MAQLLLSYNVDPHVHRESLFELINNAPDRPEEQNAKEVVLNILQGNYGLGRQIEPKSQ